jgi:hypothetical protein
MAVVDRRSLPRDWRSMNELDYGAKTCSNVKNMRAGRNLHHSFNKVMRGSWR